MTLSLRPLYRCLRGRLRQAIGAFLLSSTAFSSSAFADGITHDGAEGSLDYWVFSDDYCGWASAETLLSSKPTKVTAADLAELAKEEPIDVIAAADASNHRDANVAKPLAPLVGCSPVIVTIGEGYLSYDLSRNDRIALRMYPIAMPSYPYLGSQHLTRRDGMGPMDCLGHGVLWNEELLPSRTIATEHVNAPEKGTNELAVNLKRKRARSTTSEWLDLSSVWNQIRATVNAFAAAAKAENDRQLREATLYVMTAGEMLLTRAGIEANPSISATAGVADCGAESVCCPVPSWHIANEPPRTRDLALVPIAIATLQMPLPPAVVPDPPAIAGETTNAQVAKAEAIATAFDTAADTLERLARTLRRAGDSVVRVARASSEPGRELR